MSDLGKAIYMAASVFLFIIAATASIYLYGTLNDYLEISTNLIQSNNRVEGIDYTSSTDTKREITNAEVILSLYNMRQMNIKKLKVNEFEEVTEQNSLDGEFPADLLFFLRRPHRYSYSFDGDIVTYNSII